MSVENIPSKRPYRQGQRAETAAKTRAHITEAARDLLLERGYAGTSMRAVAERAGVAERTVYLVFPTKPALLKAVVDAAITGSIVALPLTERVRQMATAGPHVPDRQAALLADGSTELHGRTSALFAVVRGAAAADPIVAELWRAGKDGFRQNCERMAQLLVGRKKGRDVGVLATTLYILLGPETYTLITSELGLGPTAYRSWLRDRLVEVLRYEGAGPS